MKCIRECTKHFDWTWRTEQLMHQKKRKEQVLHFAPSHIEEAGEVDVQSSDTVTQCPVWCTRKKFRSKQNQELKLRNNNWRFCFISSCKKQICCQQREECNVTGSNQLFSSFFRRCYASGSATLRCRSSPSLWVMVLRHGYVASGLVTLVEHLPLLSLRECWGMLCANERAGHGHFFSILLFFPFGNSPDHSTWLTCVVNSN